jgi:hypothetical protein
VIARRAARGTHPWSRFPGVLQSGEVGHVLVAEVDVRGRDVLAMTANVSRVTPETPGWDEKRRSDGEESSPCPFHGVRNPIRDEIELIRDLPGS